MKVGDLVKSPSGRVGVVTAIGRTGEFSRYADCNWLNPDIHVFTVKEGLKLLTYNSLRIISESR